MLALGPPFFYMDFHCLICSVHSYHATIMPEEAVFMAKHVENVIFVALLNDTIL